MRFVKNFLSVLASNFATLLSGILVGFILPLVLSVEDYGYYKTFTLYVTYLGLFSLGMIDGIVLKYGGFNYGQLEKRRFRSYFRWYLIIHIIVSIVLSGLLLFLKYDFQKKILVMLIINMFALNITGFFRQISEITQRFKEYSIIKIVQSILTILSVVLIYILANSFSINVNYMGYIVMVVCSNAIITIWYIMVYREIVVGNSESLRNTFNDVKSLMHNGIPLMLANLCSTLILTIDRQFVNILFENRVYAIYAFAYNLLAMLTVATSAVSTVLYPSLKRSSIDESTKRFPVLISASLILMYAVLALFFPLTKIIRVFLPNYIDSINIFRIIFPGLPITSIITVVLHNYYKMRGESAVYFKQSIVILILSAFANGVAFFIFRSTASISSASIIVIFIWFLFIGTDLSNKMHTKILKDFSFAVISSLVFYAFSYCRYWAFGMAGYLSAFAFVVYFLKRDTVRQLKRILKKQ